MIEINSRHIINKGKNPRHQGVIKKLEKKKKRKSFTFFCLHLTLLISCVENIKSFKNKTFVNLYAHTYVVVKRNDLKDRGSQKELLNLIVVILFYCLLISMHIP